jgi:acyl carrier protein
MSTNLTSPGEVASRVLRIIADNQRKDISLVTIESSFEELGIDSMDAVNIVFAIENDFNVNVPDAEMQNIRSVRDIVEGVQKLVAEKPPTSPGEVAA